MQERYFMEVAMDNTYFRRDGKQILGTDGSSGYDEGNRLIIEGKTYYKEGNNRYFCPDDGKIYLVDDGHISTLEDGIIGTYDAFGARIDDKTETTQNDFFSTNNFQQHKIDEKTALGYYSLWELAKNHIIFLLVFFNTFGAIFVGIGTILENAYLGFFVGLIVSIAISIGIEKVVKSFFDLIRYGSIKGKIFLIIGIFALFLLAVSAYSIWESNDMIETNKQHMAEDPSYSKYAIERIEYVQKQKDITIIVCLSSTVVAIISGGIFCAKNQSKKRRH